MHDQERRFALMKNARSLVDGSGADLLASELCKY